MANTLLVLEGLLAVLTLVEKATGSIAEIQAVLSAARAEGRDVSDEEVARIQSMTDALEQDVLAKLRGIQN